MSKRTLFDSDSEVSLVDDENQQPPTNLLAKGFKNHVISDVICK